MPADVERQVMQGDKLQRVRRFDAKRVLHERSINHLIANGIDMRGQTNKIEIRNIWREDHIVVLEAASDGDRFAGQFPGEPVVIVCQLVRGKIEKLLGKIGEIVVLCQGRIFESKLGIPEFLTVRRLHKIANAPTKRSGKASADISQEDGRIIGTGTMSKF